MKLKNAVSAPSLTETECKFLVNVLLDWDQSQKTQTKTERKLWEKLIRTFDPYLHN